MIRSPPMRFESEQPPPPRGAFSVEGHRCVHERCATWPLVKKVHAILGGEARVRHATLRASFHRARYHHLPRGRHGSNALVFTPVS